MLDKLRSIFGGRASSSKEQASRSRDPRKARRFFDHAEAVADARNYDYAIECYINGLRHDPDNMSRHEALYEVAKRRKVAGGRPASWLEWATFRFRDPVDKMLEAESRWAKDPLNLKRMKETMARAVEADEAEEQLNIREIAYWIGTHIIESGTMDKPPSKNELVEVRDLFGRIDAFEEATQACRMALELDPSDQEIIRALKDLETEQTMFRGYAQGAEQGEGGFRQVIRNEEQQGQLANESATAQSEDQLQHQIDQLREQHQKDPADAGTVEKLAAALERKRTDEALDEAIELLDQLYEQTGEYKHRARAGDVRIRKAAQAMSRAKEQLNQNPDDEQLQKAWREAASQKLKLELDEYSERVREYPTDPGLKYELGKRLMAFKNYDDAIAMFQKARQDPKHRAAASEYLGQCYSAKGWNQEAIETLRAGIEAHPSESDRRGMELRYLLMDALEKYARQDSDVEAAKEAQQLASNLLQTDISYRDVQDRVESLRALVKELQQTGQETG